MNGIQKFVKCAASETSKTDASTSPGKQIPGMHLKNHWIIIGVREIDGPEQQVQIGNNRRSGGYCCFDTEQLIIERLVVFPKPFVMQRIRKTAGKNFLNSSFYSEGVTGVKETDNGQFPGVLFAGIPINRLHFKGVILKIVVQQKSSPQQSNQNQQPDEDSFRYFKSIFQSLHFERSKYTESFQVCKNKGW